MDGITKTSGQPGQGARSRLPVVVATALAVLTLTVAGCDGSSSTPEHEPGQSSRLPNVGECAGPGGTHGIRQVDCDSPDATSRVTSRGDGLDSPYDFCVSDKKSDTIFVAGKTAVCTQKLS